MKLEDLTPEQREKAKACKTPEDILALAKEEGYELSDEELQAVSGGDSWSCLGHCDKFTSKNKDICPKFACTGYGRLWPMNDT